MKDQVTEPVKSLRSCRYDNWKEGFDGQSGEASDGIRIVPEKNEGMMHEMN